MQVTSVTNADGQQMANVINFLKQGRWPNMSGDDAEALVAAKRWVQSVALDMAKQLSPVKAAPVAATPVPESTTFKVKAMGSLDAPLKGRRKKK